MPLKALIVDDEYPARKELRYLLEKYPEIQIVGEAANAHEALELIDALDYSILFLDIDMPGFSGLELTRRIKEMAKSPYVIFVTAHEQFALEAFSVDAVDYLLKPIDPSHLDRAIGKILKRIEEKSIASKPQET
ncbi:MAG TPA: response regulator, partial [Clostridia bacterium]|nr:response regulator [Clostridia bacterium]